MPSFFSRLKGKDGAAKKGQQEQIVVAPQRPTWTDAWTRTSVEPEEIQALLRGCTLELKSKGMTAGNRRHEREEQILTFTCSSRCAILPPPIQTDFRPKCSSHIHKKLFRQQTAHTRRLSRTRAPSHRANGFVQCSKMVLEQIGRWSC